VPILRGERRCETSLLAFADGDPHPLRNAGSWSTCDRRRWSDGGRYGGVSDHRGYCPEPRTLVRFVLFAKVFAMERSWRDAAEPGSQ
jgi:hypothetical protein